MLGAAAHPYLVINKLRCVIRRRNSGLGGKVRTLLALRLVRQRPLIEVLSCTAGKEYQQGGNGSRKRK